MKILVTGATGFIGSALMERLAKDPRYQVVGTTRKNLSHDPQGPLIRVKDMEGPEETDWTLALRKVDVLIHTAGRAHILHDKSPDPLALFRKVNVEGACLLARQAALAGVRRFIFLSSIGVHGTRTQRPLTENSTLHPASPYAISKVEAEQGLRRIAKKTGMELVIIRPPLVYGPNAPGNFGRLLDAVAKSLPLPLASVHTNRRSFIAMDNLTDFITLCMEHPNAANETFLIADGEDLSTRALIQKLGKALGKKPRLLPFPPRILEKAAAIFGRKDLAEKLLDSFQIDIGKARTRLNWTPPLSLDEALAITAQGHFGTRKPDSHGSPGPSVQE